MEEIEISIGGPGQSRRKSAVLASNIQIFRLLSNICFLSTYKRLRSSTLVHALLYSLFPQRLLQLFHEHKIRSTGPLSSLVCTCFGWINNSPQRGVNSDLPDLLHKTTPLLSLLLIDIMCNDSGARTSLLLSIPKKIKKSATEDVSLFVIASDENGQAYVDIMKREVASSLPAFSAKDEFIFWVDDDNITCSGTILDAVPKKKGKEFRSFLTSLAIGIKETAIDSDDSNESSDLPTSRSHFSTHTKFLLESNLRKYEIVYPADIAGFFEAESIYYRKNVKKLRSKEAWLTQFGKTIKNNENPAKVVLLSSKTGKMQPLYGEWQVENYTPPVAKDGIVPRNDHGNVDMFTASMLPGGCVYITDPGAWRVAKGLGIDYADACVGFSFHGGKAVPDLQGIVICSEHHDSFRNEYHSKAAQYEEEARNQALAKINAHWESACDAVMVTRKLKHTRTAAGATEDHKDTRNSKGSSIESVSNSGKSIFQSVSGKDEVDISNLFE